MNVTVSDRFARYHGRLDLVGRTLRVVAVRTIPGERNIGITLLGMPETWSLPSAQIPVVEN